MYSESYEYLDGGYNPFNGQPTYTSGSVKYGCDINDPKNVAEALKGEMTFEYSVPTSRTSSIKKSTTFIWYDKEWTKS